LGLDGAPIRDNSQIIDLKLWEFVRLAASGKFRSGNFYQLAFDRNKAVSVSGQFKRRPGAGLHEGIALSPTHTSANSNLCARRRTSVGLILLASRTSGLLRVSRTHRSAQRKRKCCDCREEFNH
jgi:hypothetical protein